MIVGAVAVLCALTGALSGCARPGDGHRPQVLRVPQQAATIQEAVDRARPGDMVLVAPGTYHETVRITRPGMVLRGADRDRVIVDGGFTLGNGIVVTAPGVAVENLTVRRFKFNGVLVTGAEDRAEGGAASYERLDVDTHPPLTGFRVSYVTAYNNALYGVYAFDARSGVIEHTYTSGHADAGIYVGQCRDCSIVVRSNTAERNAVGYEATNVSGPLHVVGNVFRRNRVGLTTGSDPLEALAPQHGSTIMGNVIADNNERATPEQADGGFGLGVGIGGGTGNRVENNLITGNRRAGVLVTEHEGYVPTNNRIVGNHATGNGPSGARGSYDLVFAPTDPARATGNCLARRPSGCAAAPRPVPVPTVPKAPPGIPYSEVAAPPRRPDLPGGASAPVLPPKGEPPTVDERLMRLPADGKR
ncbi:Nitrous oxidase accessory protein NosD, contains tandem CASH domains [Sinosporangium album]|uniref:Nitrous oxidase accessory protein NosD, contains tandem CASH domains n=1 Tax=Sinosporangium album TaxID=504805 RepID=A0A1G7S656_9ACTN|nr:Nitrous oxidase accessory protein NosD, contains tandem CASH domains [Sinosporangium album]